MEFPYGEQKNLLDVAEVLSGIRKSGFQGRVDDKLREDLGGGSNEKINPLKKAAISVHEEAVRYRCSPPDFLMDVLSAYLGRYEEKGWRRAQKDLDEKDATISTLREKIAELEEANRELTSDNTSLLENVRAAQVERERVLVRVEEREKAAESRLQETLAVQNELRRTVEQATARAVTHEHNLQEATRQLEQAKAEVRQLSAKSKELNKELAAAREELTALRVQRETDQDRLREYQAEIAALRTRDNAREDEVRRLNEDLRAAERREVEANQRANSLQLEIERLRGQFESGKTRPKSEPKDGK